MDGAYGLNSRQQNGLVLLSPTRRKRDIGASLRAAAEYEFDLVRRRPVTEACSNLGYRNSLRSFAYAPLNLALDPNSHVNAPPPPSCVGPIALRSCITPRGRLRQLWERSGAPSASALHQLSSQNLRFRFNSHSQMSQLT